MRAIVWLGIALSVGACARRVGPGRDDLRAADFYPLAVGNYWKYDASFLGEKREQTVEVVKNEGGFYLDTQGGQLMADSFGVRDQKRYLIREPLEQGRTWTNVLSVASVEHYRITTRGESCEAPAGKFKDCLEVEGRNRVDPKTTLVNRLTFAPGVGIVRIEVVAEAGDKRIPQTELSLKEYKVKPTSDPKPSR
jgi:hypothetical protein